MNNSSSLKLKFQEFILKAIKISLILYPFYSAILFTIALTLRHKTAYKKKYLVILYMSIMACIVTIIGKRPLPLLPLPFSTSTYLFGFFPIQMLLASLLSIVILIFDLSNEERWLVQEE